MCLVCFVVVDSSLPLPFFLFSFFFLLTSLFLSIVKYLFFLFFFVFILFLLFFLYPYFFVDFCVIVFFVSLSLQVSAIESLLVAAGVSQVIGWVGDEVDDSTTQEDIDVKVTPSIILLELRSQYSMFFCFFL